MTIAKLQLQDPMGNKSTLRIDTENGFIGYRLYGSWNSSGVGHCLSNLQCELPQEEFAPNNPNQLIDDVVKIINEESVKRVVNVIRAQSVKNVDPLNERIESLIRGDMLLEFGDKVIAMMDDMVHTEGFEAESIADFLKSRIDHLTKPYLS